MAKQGVRLTRDSVDALRRRLRQIPTPSKFLAGDDAAEELSFLARLTTFDETAGWSWVRIYPDAGATGRISDRDPAITGNNAWLLGIATAAPGDVVTLCLAGKDGSGAMWFYFLLPVEPPEPIGQYIGQYHGMVAQNVDGWLDIIFTAQLP